MRIAANKWNRQRRRLINLSPYALRFIYLFRFSLALTVWQVRLGRFASYPIGVESRFHVIFFFALCKIHTVTTHGEYCAVVGSHLRSVLVDMRARTVIGRVRLVGLCVCMFVLVPATAQRSREWMCTRVAQLIHTHLQRERSPNVTKLTYLHFGMEIAYENAYIFDVRRAAVPWFVFGRFCIHIGTYATKIALRWFANQKQDVEKQKNTRQRGRHTFGVLNK